MKKALLFVAGLIVLCMITNANVISNDNPRKILKANESQGKVFDENTRLINLGVGFGSGYYSSYGLGSGYVYHSTPALSLSYEQAYPKKLGPGFLGVGIYLGYQHASSRFNGYYYKGDQFYYEHNWNYYVAAARGVYHWDVLNTKNAEVYGGMIVGFRISTYSYKTNNTDPDAKLYQRHDSGISPVASLLAGARWYFVSNVALFGEVGYGISYIKGGFTFKF
jgi:hypothetical protein